MQNEISLYLVPTPIGNLKDITLRAIETLKNVDYILSEDTRHTNTLLKAYDIDTKQISYRDQNHTKIITYILEQMKDGKTFALVSDAGTPTISDPGYKLVQEVWAMGLQVISLPGASAILTALSASGCPTDKFTFVGFLPKSSNKKMDILKKYGGLDASMVIFESPYRLVKLLEEILDCLGNRYVCVASEISKVYESYTTGKIIEVLEKLKTQKIKGEYTVVIAKT